MEEARVEEIDFGNLRTILPNCIKIAKLIDHAVHKLSYTDAYLGDVYHDMKMLKEKLLLEFPQISLNNENTTNTSELAAGIALLGERIDNELLNDEYVQISAIVNPARGCRVVKRSFENNENLNFFMPSVETALSRYITTTRIQFLIFLKQ